MSKGLISLFLAIVLLLMPVSGVMAAETGQVQLDVNFIGIYPSQNGIMVQDVYDFNNLDSKPFAGGELTDSSGKKRNGFLLPLPSGFSIGHDITGLNSGEYSVVPEGIQVYKPLPPGKTEIEILYELKVSAPTTITKKVAFNTKQMVIDTPKKEFSLQSNLLQAVGSVTEQGTEYARYYAENISAGSNLSVAVNKGSGTPVRNDRVAAGYNVELHPQGHVALFASEPLVYTDPHIWAAYLFIMVGLGIAALVLWYRVRRKPNLEADDEEDNDQLFLRLKSKQDALLLRISALDEEFKTGGIDEQEYRETREKYKELLVRVKMQLKELT